MKVTKLENFEVWDSDTVRVKFMGNVTEVFYSSTISKGSVIRKLDADTYLDTRSGEVKEFVHIENRSQDLKSVARTMAQGRDVINANVSSVENCRWLTLTYAENMTDPKKLRKDFENFNSRLRDIFGHYEYITAAEPQGRGAWHLHVLLIFDSVAPFMKNEVVKDCWKQGFVTVKKLKNVDNVGAYLSAYLGDIELDDYKKLYPNGDGRAYEVHTVDVEDDEGKTVTKHYLKGSRLFMYPPGFHIFRWSKGIKKPNVKHLSYSKAMKLVSDSALTYRKCVNISDSNTDFSSDLVYEYYNSKRV